MIIPLIAAKQYIVEMNGQYKLPTSIKTIHKFKTMSAFVVASDKSLEVLSNLKGVKNIWEDLIIQAPEPKVMEAINTKEENNVIHELTAVDMLHKQGYFGEGAKVGIIDTGVNYHHPAFGSCFKTPGCRVINGYDFSGADGTTESEDPDDNCRYHGTHVGGIVAGDDELFTGVAPKAQLGAYRIFPCIGGALESIIMRALEQAYHDGMDIVNLSLGSPSGWDMRPYSHLIDRLSELGLIVIASQGNSGAEGLFMGGSPSISKTAIIVASFNNMAYIKFQMLKVGTLEIHTEVVKEGTGSFKIAVSSSTPEVSDDGCVPYAVQFNGAAVLIKRGTCALIDKIQNAVKAGAGAVLLYNNVPGSFGNGFVEDNLSVGAYMLTGTDGDALCKKSGETIVISFKKYSQGSPSSGLPSDFSSYGPGSLLQLKPEAAGIGGSVFSALPLNKGKYGVLSGTSMSSPYISGVAALYIGKYGKTDPFTMKRLLMNNAEIVDDGERTANGKVKNKDGVYSVIKQGAGLINATKVMDNTVSAKPPKLELGDQKWYSFFKRRTITISNGHSKSVTYNIKHIPALSVTGKQFGKVTSKATYAKAIITSSITISGKSSKQISVNIIPPWLPNKEQWVYSGYIQITPQKEGFPISVPYMGYKGALKDVSVLGNDGKFPNVITSGHLEDPFSGYHSSKDVVVADFTANGTIVFQLRAFQPTPLLTIELYDAKNSEKMGYVHQQQALPRTTSVYNSATPYQYVHQVEWIFGSCIACYTESLDIGKVKWKAAVDGQYFVKIIVNKPFNDGTESYTSPRIYINRN